MRRISAPLFALTLLLAACGGTREAPASRPAPGPSPSPTPTEPAPEPLPTPPWAGAVLSPADAPGVSLEQWRAAENRETCALLAFRDPAPAAEPRAASFGGGWGVAYDLPGQRSAYGVAGTGTTPGPDTYDRWPHRLRWSDGSQAGYGPEGGTGPNQLAYVRVAGQGCLYNVWSRLGVEHLERLLDELRFVDTGD